MALLTAAALAAAVTAQSQTCRWDGTAPFCSGECGDGETEKTRASAGSGGVQNLESSNPFGGDCATGSKALCCRTPGRSCRWDGTAPFCDGECRSGETAAEPPAGSSSGKACVTGSKAYCCRSTGSVGSTGQRLETSAEFSRFAAIWEKQSGPAWQARHGLSGIEYQQAFDSLTRQGYRLTDVSGYGVAGQDRYAAIWEKSEGPAWQARHGLNTAQYQQTFDRLAQQGLRPVHVSGYTVGGQDRYAAIWQAKPGVAWVARHGLSAAQFQQEFDRLLREGYRLTDVSGYNVGGQDRYAAIWEKSPGPAWQARHGLTSSQYQQTFNQLAQQGFRLAHISGWSSGTDYRYAAIWVKNPGPAWVARHGMVSDVYQEEFDALVKDGYRLKNVSGYHPALGN
ncbi:MAG TPA: hypothetical protein VIT92_17510 [Burkholderiaceae bacterium]